MRLCRQFFLRLVQFLGGDLFQLGDLLCAALLLLGLLVLGFPLHRLPGGLLLLGHCGAIGGLGLLAVLHLLSASVCRLGLCGLLGGLTVGLLLLCGGAIGGNLGHSLGLCTGLSNRHLGGWGGCL